MNARKEFLRRFARNKPALAGVAVLVLITLAAVLAGLLFPASPWDMVGTPFIWPGRDPEFPLGTDMMGRDLAAGLFHGARVSLVIGLVATAVAVFIGVAVGAAAGYYRGRVDTVLMRLTELFQTLPPFIFAIVVVAILRPSVQTIVVAIGLVSWPAVARLVRAEFIALREREFVQAARFMGVPGWTIIVRHILPNMASLLIIDATINVSSLILAEVGL